jgi:hypothetical protein
VSPPQRHTPGDQSGRMDAKQVVGIAVLPYLFVQRERFLQPCRTRGAMDTKSAASRSVDTDAPDRWHATACAMSAHASHRAERRPRARPPGQSWSLVPPHSRCSLCLAGACNHHFGAPLTEWHSDEASLQPAASRRYQEEHRIMVRKPTVSQTLPFAVTP